MLDLSALATTVANPHKKIRWLFEVYKDGSSTPDYYWSTQVCTDYTGTKNYTAKIIPESFGGISFKRNGAEVGINAPNSMEFSIPNASVTLAPTLFENARVDVILEVCDGGSSSAWNFYRSCRMICIHCVSQYQTLVFKCEDYYQKYMDADYPNTEYVKDLYVGYDPDDESNDNVCIPEIFGTAYIPLRSVHLPAVNLADGTSVSAVAASGDDPCMFLSSSDEFTNFVAGQYVTSINFASASNNNSFLVYKSAPATLTLSAFAGLVDETAPASGEITQGACFYILGDPAETFTISKVRSPRSVNLNSVWTSATYNFLQSEQKAGNGVTYQSFLPIIAQNRAGEVVAPGYWTAGERRLDMPTKFYRDTTASTTDPADVIRYILTDFEIPDTWINTTVSRTAYQSWSLAFSGGFWFKQERSKVLSQLLIQCNSRLAVDERNAGTGLLLAVLSGVSCATVTSADIIFDSFSYNPLSSRNERDNYDGGYVAWQDSDESQDQLIKIPVSVTGATINNMSSEIIEMPFVKTQAYAQKLGQLYFQRKFGRIADISFQSKGTLLALQPDDVITIDGSNYGGTYDVVIDSVSIAPDLTMSFRCSRYDHDMLDWGDITPTTVTIAGHTDISSWKTDLVDPVLDDPDTSSSSDVHTLVLEPLTLSADTYHGVILKNLICGTTINQWSAVYLSGATLLLADKSASGEFPARGFACSDGLVTDAIDVLVQGTINNSNWTWSGAGDTLYLSTAGGITATAATVSGHCGQIVGFSLGTEIAYINVSGHYVVIE